MAKKDAGIPWGKVAAAVSVCVGLFGGGFFLNLLTAPKAIAEVQAKVKEQDQRIQATEQAIQVIKGYVEATEEQKNTVKIRTDKKGRRWYYDTETEDWLLLPEAK